MPNVFHQKISKCSFDKDGKYQAHIVGFEHQVKMSYGEFRQLAIKEDEKNDAVSDDRYEDAYWDGLHQRFHNKSIDSPIYAIDNTMTLFPKDQKFWNLNRFTEKESIIH